MISVKDENSEYISSIHSNGHPDFQVETATEIKGVLVSIQHCQTNPPRFWIFKSRPQSCNDTSAFIQQIYNLFERSEKLNFLGFSVDGVSCESDKFLRSICQFLSGKYPWSGNFGPNHYIKSPYHAVQVGFCVGLLGEYIVDMGLMKNVVYLKFFDKQRITLRISYFFLILIWHYLKYFQISECRKQ